MAEFLVILEFDKKGSFRKPYKNYGFCLSFSDKSLICDQKNFFVQMLYFFVCSN